MICEECGATLKVGDWPFCPPANHPDYGITHGKTLKTIPFKPYYDAAFGTMVESLGHKWQMQREMGLVEGGRSTGADLSAKSLQDAKALLERGELDFSRPGGQDQLREDVRAAVAETFRDYLT